MAVIKINNVGGLLPSVLARALPDSAAQVASDLLARTTEFRPLLNDTTAATSGVTNPKTLYRLARTSGGTLNTNLSTGWLASAAEKNYVRGQLDDNLTERTYVTFADGSAAPRAINAAGADRLLGVPAPSNAPVPTLIVTDELATDELTAVQATAELAISNAVKSALVTSYSGNSIPAATPSAVLIGWAPHGGAGMPSTSDTQWNFLVPMSGSTTAKGFEYLMAPEFAGKVVTYSAVVYWAVAMDLFAQVSTINSGTLTTALNAITRVSVTGVAGDTAALLLSGEVTSIVNDTVAYYSLAQLPAKPMVDKALAATASIRYILDGVNASTFVSALYASDAFVAGLAALVGTASATSGTSAYGVSTDKIFTRASVLASNPEITGYSGITYWIPSGSTTSGNNIRTDINASIVTTSGVKTLDIVKLKQLLKAQYERIISFVADPTKKATMLSQVGYYCDYDTQDLVDFFATANLSTIDPTEASDVGRALKEAMALAKTALVSLREIYAGREAQTLQVAKNAYSLGAAARLASSAITRLVETRFYICTYVSDWGEESAPSAPSLAITMDQNDKVTVVCPAPPTGRNILKTRIYRSNAGSTGAEFQFLAQLDDATNNYMTTYTDVQAAFTADPVGLSRQDYVEVHYLKFGRSESRTSPEVLASTVASDGFWTTPNLTYVDSKTGDKLQEVCPSTTWLTPPPALRGLVGLPNGVMAGYVENYVAFCESYIPYAWPSEYEITVPFPINALGVFGQTLVVMHQGGVDYMSGADASSMSQQRGVSLQVCVSSRSVVSVENGVIYASPDGLCLANSNGVQLLTTNHFTREDWQTLKPSSMVGGYHEQTYYFMYDTGSVTGCYAIHAETGKLTTLGSVGSTFYNDLLSDRLFMVQGTNIVALFAGTTYRSAIWRSKKFVLPAHAGYAWLSVESNFSASITVRLYGDGVLYHTATVATRTPVRVPAGRYLEHDIEVQSTARWNVLTLASSTQELRSL